MSHRFLSLLLGLLAMLLASCGKEEEQARGGQESPESDPAARAAEAERNAAKLAKEAEERDRKLWNDEVAAQRHEAVVIGLWDRLRSTTGRWELLRDFPFQTIRVGKLGIPEKLENGVHVTKFAPDPEVPDKALDREKWSALLLMLRNRGFVVAQSEWHHSRFVPADGERAAQSEISFEVHLRNPGPPVHTLVAKGTMAVTWTAPRAGLENSAPAPAPEIDTIDARQITLVEREGVEGFDRTVRIAPEPEQPGGAVEVAPLLVYDLDGDGLSEIVLGGINTVLRNQGGFQFEREALLAGQTSLRNAANLADFTGDGLIDLLGVKPDGTAVLVAGDETGRFGGAQEQPWSTVTAHPSAMTCGDIDGDGDLDVWLTQYRPPYTKGQMPTPFYDANDGYPSYLLLNDGTGKFTDATEAAGLAAKRQRRTYSTSFVDLDEDGDLDLLVVSDFSGLDLYTNDGQGSFTEATGQFVDERHGFGMSHAFGDFDLDGKEDFYMAGMSSTTARRLERLGLERSDFPEYTKMRGPMTFGNRLYQRRGARFVQTALNDRAARAGWTWGTAAADFDNDGDDDLYVANGHISGKSATDYCTRYWCHDLYTGSSVEDLTIAHLLTDKFRPKRMQGLNTGGISWNGYEKNRLFMNLAGEDFLDVGFVMGVGFEEDCRSVVAADLDNDGKPDLAVVGHGWQPGSEIIPKQSLFLLRNQIEAREGSSWLGVRLLGSARTSPVGARVTIEGSFGSRTKSYLTGDSFYAQHPAVAHFGIPEGAQVARVWVRWPEGRETVVQNPQVGSYLAVSAPTRE